MHIDRIKSMQGNGVFRQFAWPSTLSDFARYNLIYGWNGTGKSTLTRIFVCLQNRTVPEGAVTLIVNGHEISGGAFGSNAVPIRVFNREFVERNVLASTQDATNSPEVPAIFVLGEKNVESQKAVDAAKVQLQKLQTENLTLVTKSKESAGTLEDFCTEKARDIKDKLRGIGSSFNNYNKGDFKKTAERLLKLDDASKLILDDAGRATRVQQHQSTQRGKLLPLNYELPSLVKLYDDLRDILGRVVTSTVIDSLREDPDAASWVKEGLEKHESREATVCLFCDQQLPNARLTALNAHFNDAYQAFLVDIDRRLQRLDVLDREREQLDIPKSTEVYDHLAAKHKASAERLSEELSKVKAAVAFGRERLGEKRSAPFEQRALTDDPPAIDASAVDAVNDVINLHNRHSDDFAKQVKKAREDLEASEVASALEQFTKHQKASQDAIASVKVNEQSTARLQQQIAKLERELREHRKPADELNRDLQHYLGHGDIQLSISATGYQITRHGTTATRLSEGEQTAIALLYFLKTLSSKDFKLTEGIVVLDDPVCSLDANALFSAFGFIKERTKSAKQLFVLTHNFTFFRQVRAWFHKLPNQNKKDVALRPARFYMLRCLTVQGQRCSELCWLDPLLERYESDYHFIFSKVHELATGPMRPLDEYFGAPNLARKLLETFLAFHVPGPSSDSVFSKLEDMNFDEHKKTRILRFLNDYSHSNSVGGDQQDFTILNETPAVLSDLLAMIGQANKQHYEGMLALMPLKAPATPPDAN